MCMDCEGDPPSGTIEMIGGPADGLILHPEHLPHTIVIPITVFDRAIYLLTLESRDSMRLYRYAGMK